MATATIKNVELVKVGDWSASVGDGKVTRQNLSDAVQAYSDKLVDRPALKIGHQDDNVFNATVNDGAGDGEPAYGWIENVTAGDGGADRPNKDALYGDLVGMPSKLAEIVPTAYRRRSVELGRGVKTAAGKAYSMVITGMALLGITRPAVKSLADVMELYSEPAETSSVTVIEIMDGLTAEQTASFGAILDDLTKVHNTGVVPPQTKTASDSDVVEQTTGLKENKMPALTKDDVIKALDAEGDKSVEDRLAELVQEPELTDEEKKAAEEKAAADKVEADKKAADEKAAAEKAAETDAGDKPETVTLSAAQYAELSEGVKAGTQAAKVLDDQRRDGIANDAFKAGKITKTELAEWRNALERDEEGTKTLLSTLTPRFAVTEIGDDAATDTKLSEAQSKAEDAWVASQFPTAG